MYEPKVKHHLVETPSLKGQDPFPHPKAEEDSRSIHPEPGTPSLVVSGTLNSDFNQQVGLPW